MSKVWFGAFLLVPLTACTLPEDAVRVRAANDFNCDEDKVTVRSIGAGGYRATGCGQGGTYVCGGETCIRERK